MKPNPTETRIALARIGKALAIASAIRCSGVTADQAESAPDDWWQAAASNVGKRVPSPTTRAMVVELLRCREPASVQPCTECGKPVEVTANTLCEACLFAPLEDA